MLVLLFEYIRNLGIKIPTVFEYCSTRMAIAAAFSLLLTIVLGKYFIKKLYELKIGDRVRTEDCPLLGELHHNKKDTPTMGGILILFVLLMTLLMFMNLKSSFTLILGLTTVVFGSVGAYDDYLKLKHKNTKGLSARRKMLFLSSFSLLVGAYLLFPTISSSVQLGSWFTPPSAKEYISFVATQDAENINSSIGKTAVLTTHEYASRIYVPFIKDPIFTISGIATIGLLLFIIIVMTGTSNAVNLTDGLDGLATGTVMMASLAFSVIAFISNNSDLSRYLNILYIEGSGEIAVFLAALVGACLGFLWYNGHPAQVFMGDTGSLALGGILGVSAVLLKRELLLAIIGGVFVAEACSVIMQVGSYKLRNKKRIFLCAPLHHHYEYKGWPESKVVVRFWIVGLFLAILGIATLKFQ